MNPAACQWLDRTAIHFAAVRMARLGENEFHLDAALSLLQRPDFFSTSLDPAELEFTAPNLFHFPSARAGDSAVNNVAHGRLYPCCEDWTRRPVVLLLHGWNDVLDHYYFFPRHARKLNRMGLNAATLQMPWHFDRRPRDLGARGNFLSADILRTVEAARQALADIRSLINWLEEKKCPAVGLWGVSLGAWLAGLTVCHDSRIGSAVLTVPVARLDRLIQEVPFCATIRAAVKGRLIDLRKLNLAANQPLTDRDNILLIEAEHDLFVPRETVEELWRVWGEPPLWRLRCGHISVLGARGLADRIVRWMAAKAGAPALK